VQQGKQHKKARSLQGMEGNGLYVQVSSSNSIAFACFT
jgi:hypothetical protein